MARARVRVKLPKVQQMDLKSGQNGIAGALDAWLAESLRQLPSTTEFIQRRDAAHGHLLDFVALHRDQQGRLEIGLGPLRESFKFVSVNRCYDANGPCETGQCGLCLSQVPRFL